MTEFVEGQTAAPRTEDVPSREKDRVRAPADPPRERRRSNIGPYKLERRIEGGKAECWLCTDTRDGSKKFLKKFPSPKMPSDDDRIRDRAAYENQVRMCNEFLLHHQQVMRDLAGLRVGNGALVKPLDAFWHEASFFKISPFVEGLQTFSAEVVRSWSTQRRTIAIRSVLLALRELHDQGIAHGDIKLDNIHLVETPSGPVARLIDFDDAYRADAPPLSTVLGGTEDYYSPEVLVYKGFAASPTPLPLGFASDLFSLSLALHEAFSKDGRKPRWGGRETSDAGMCAISGDTVDYQPLGTGRPLLEYRLKLCLALEPRHRPRVTELLSACGTNLGRIA